MFKRILAILGLSAAALSAAETFSFSGCEIAAPAGWREMKRTTNALTLRSSDGKEQAMITTMSFGTEATFDDFKRVCQKRIEAEKREVSDGLVNPSEPFKDGNLFGMMFSGGDKKSGRVFSGYLSYTKRELITLYVEGVVTPTNHLATFKQFIGGLKRR